MREKGGIPIDIKVEKEATYSGEQINQRKRLERDWFWIALLSFLGMYYQLSISPNMIPAMSGPGKSQIYSIGFALIIACLMLVPPLVKRLGILNDFRKFRVFFTMVSAAGIAAFSGFIGIVALGLRVPEAVTSCLIYISLALPGVLAGCALHRAVEVVTVKSAATFSGLLIVIWFLLYIVHMAVIGYFKVFSVFLISEVIAYAAPLIISLILLFRNGDSCGYTAPARATYFSDALFVKFMIAAVLLLLLDVFHDGTYYASESFADIFGAWAALATTFLPVISGCILVILVWKNKWFPAMAAVALLICFEQGLILFFEGDDRLAIAYAIASILNTSGPLVLSLFIPVVFSTQRRRGATAITGFVSIWLAAGIADTFLPDETSKISALTAFVTPAVTFVVSLVTIAYLFYLYSENNKTYIAELIAEFKNRDITQIGDTVSKTDQFEGLALTPREKEVCTLLLRSLTVRQIAGELGLAFATVNGYYRSLYKKLGISSKAELFMRFGPESAAPSTSVPVAVLNK